MVTVANADAPIASALFGLVAAYMARGREWCAGIAENLLSKELCVTNDILILPTRRAAARSVMAYVGLHQAKSPTLIDTAWRTVYRLGFPLARVWWRLRRPQHEGALVAIHVKTSLLLLRSSYRVAWNFPGGGVRSGEAPEAAARRELAEEIGLVADNQIVPIGEVNGLWDGRRDRVHLFALYLDQLPVLHLDGREIIDACLVPLEGLRSLPLTGPVRAYIDGRHESV